MLSFIKEFINFLLKRKKILAFTNNFSSSFFGSLVVLTQGTAVAPHLYYFLKNEKN